MLAFNTKEKNITNKLPKAIYFKIFIKKVKKLKKN